MKHHAVGRYLLLVPFLLLGVGQPTDCQTPAKAPASSAKSTSPETRVAGVLVSDDEKVDAGARVLLIEARLVGMDGKEVRELPPQGTVILDANISSPIMTTRTDIAGQFAFARVPTGRYCLGVTLKSEGKVSAKDVTLLRRVGDSRTNLVFDIEPEQNIDLGKVSRREP